METINYIELVQKAQLGDKDCLNRLAEAVRERLYTYVYRHTLTDDLTHDVVQESILKMLEAFNELKDTDQFWPWLYKIALNKLRLHRRNQQQNIPDPDSSPAHNDDSQEAIAGMVFQEFKKIVFTAIQDLKPDHRSVINMRCYEQMQFSQIAKVMDCSEFAAQKLFYRAQKSLKKQLAKHGFGKGSLLMALILFGKLTAPTKAAAAHITTATVTTKVPLTVSLASMAAAKTTILSLTTAAVLTTGAIVATSVSQTTPDNPKNESTYFYNQPEKPMAKQAALQYWYYTPSEAVGSVMMRVKGMGKASNDLHCKYLQNADANYRFDTGTNTVHINNFHQWDEDLNVWRLPADSLKLSMFLESIDGGKRLTESVYPSEAGTLFIVNAPQEQHDDQLEVAHHCNVLGEDFFKIDWPANARVVDNRDEMHKRGWTYFTISGQINGKEVKGTGRIPFVYAKCRSQDPWLKLIIGSETFLDTEFDGLCRPWEGLHAIDTIRRDAAKKQIPFETALRADNLKAQITLSLHSGKIIYTIDMQNDVIEKIIFTGDRQGQMTFDYLQKVDNIKNEFTKPSYQYRKNAAFCILNIN